MLGDWGLDPLKPYYRRDLHEILSDPYQKRSTVVVAHLSLENLARGDRRPALAATSTSLR